ncbi:hypothetical protein [Pseudogulbenkiania subflava]|uniref:Uncharacterized protein n=1 Tax=Pseudogulbenkiania subflava DSM 22618 TaxID=1123014 RepID=A0A1Y6B6T0_9NEIS|nr:hypothetical protein [Pseudogulbenkiania subflava]SME94991.1 hypothetical protein SAMN02745746_00317 [Pseudogulbenkiania subflava DSM 22618]
MRPMGRNKKKEANAEQELKIWEKTIEVQMHFNELQMKIRNFSILVVSALVGASGVALKEHIQVDVVVLGLHVYISLASMLLAVSAVMWLAFFFMDHFWYYPLLVGAVNHGLNIEKALVGRLPEIGLTKAIGDASPGALFGITLRSRQKSFVFYGAIFFSLTLLAIVTGQSVRGDQIEKNGSGKARENKVVMDEYKSPNVKVNPGADPQKKLPVETINVRKSS